MIGRIMVAEGSKVIMNALSSKLSAHFNIIKASSLSEALETISSQKVDALITARTLPDGTGFDLAAEVKKKTDIPVIMLVADENVQVFDLHPFV